jgi:hypothetical protein
MCMKSLCIGAGVALAVSLGIATAEAGPIVSKFRLSDHPDGNRNPPPYGFRFDNMFASLAGASGGVTTFSMDHFGGVILTVTDDTANAGSITININGKVYGGEAPGSVYAFGEGAYMLDFTYTTNVSASGTGWKVDPQSVSNSGTLTALAANTGVADGSVFSFTDKAKSSGESFLFKQDEHRLSGHPQAGQGYWVGRGWIQNGAPGTHDFLFLGMPEMIPLPGGALMAGAGMLILSTRRRRQTNL